MYYRDFYDYEPELQHPAKRDRPRDIASLYVHTAEWADFRRICEAHGAAQIVGVRKVRIIPAHDVEVLCQDADAAMALRMAWGEFCEISSHRPRTVQEREEWGLKVLPEFANIPRDWTF
jgi:hypothetical protein